MSDVRAAEVSRCLSRMRSVDMSSLPIYPGGQKQLDADCQVLASAYLAEHPADSDEPVDWKWLIENASEVKHYTPNVDPTACDFHGPTDEHGNFLFVRIQSRLPGWFITIHDGHGAEIYVSCGPTTRRQVRQLLAALGGNVGGGK